MPGLGGSFGFCDPGEQIGYAYAPSRLGPLPFNDPREQRLRKALYAALRTVSARKTTVQRWLGKSDPSTAAAGA